MIIIYVFAILGILFIISYIILLLFNYQKRKQKQNKLAAERPSYEYMQKVGIKCPDYWKLNKEDNNKYYCIPENINVLTDIDNSCFSSDEEITFDKLPKNSSWIKMSRQDKINFLNKQRYGNISRCKWVNKCNKNKFKNVWLGVDKYC